jgi:O-antigen ligase
MSATRNGLIVFVILTIVGGLIALRYKTDATRQWWAVVGVCVVITLAGILAGLKADSRWNGFLATVPAAWDTETHRAWLKGETSFEDLPRTEAGTVVDASAYYRIAFAKEGVKLLLEHPWGTEIGRDTFRRLVHEKYGTAGMSHAHDGLLDLGLSAGFPGMVLWVAFLAALATLGVKAWKRDRDTLGLALFLAVLGFGLRMLMDSTLRDHIIEEFVMVAGLLAGAIAYREGARARGPA